jgi:hypothetical protein
MRVQVNVFSQYSAPEDGGKVRCKRRVAFYLWRGARTAEERLGRCAMRLADTVVALDERTLASVQAALPGRAIRKVPNCLVEDDLDTAPRNKGGARLYAAS